MRFPVADGDRDRDGLSDAAEGVIGTSPDRFSTSGDRLGDGEKVRRGLNPFGPRPAATGVIGRLPLAGPARAVVATADRVYVATGEYGLAVVDTAAPPRPVVPGRLDLPGNATGVAVDDTLALAVVATGTTGAHVIDVRDPSRPTPVRSFPGDIGAVAVFEGLGYVADRNTLQSFDLVTGDPLDSAALIGSRVTGLARDGAFLYAMTDTRVLSVFEPSATGLAVRGQTVLSNGGGTRTAGAGFVYAAADT